MKKALVFLAVGVLVGCASEDKSTKTELDQKVAMQPAISEQGGVASAAHKAFMNAPGITEAQKIKLSEMLTSTFVEAAKIKMEFGKTKGALFEALVSPSSTKKEVDAFKKRLVDLDKKRLDIMIKSLEDTEKIIGKNQQTAEYFKRIFHEMSTHGEM